jgi:hypothetical protein
MKFIALFRRPEWLTLLLAVGVGGPSLFEAWRQAPLEAGSAVCMAVWLLPLGRHLVKSRFQTASRSSGIFTAAALALLVIGGAADLNFIKHGALALAFAATAPRCDVRLLGWLAVAPAWMPAMGWLAAGWPSGLVAAARLLACAVGAAIYFFAREIPATDSSPDLST